jgi:hypothetical protein
MSTFAPRISRIVDEAILAVSGRDGRSFLHAQLTQDIADLPADQAAFAAWADARGRVRALFRVVPAGNRWLLVTSADLIPSLLGKMRLFVLRADVAIEPADSLRVHAIVGDASAWAASERLELPAESNRVRFARDIYWLCIAPDLIYAIGSADAIHAVCGRLEESPATNAELAAIRLGLPIVDAGLAERYIPQMLSLDRLGGVSFDKGCYPGQEVVARTHNLGAVKRRLRRFGAAVSQVPARGTSLRDVEGAAAGDVIRAAPAASGIELLAVTGIDIAAEKLRIEGAPDVPLVDLGLPYV